MILNNDQISSKLKEIRHSVISSISVLNDSLLSQRDVDGDVGSNIETITEQAGLSSIISANAKRAEEGLRVIEEVSKLPDLCKSLDSNIFKKYRFEVYKLEQELQSRILRTRKIKYIKGIYAIIDTSIIKFENLEETARKIIRGGASVLQLRDKISIRKDLLEIATDLQILCHENNVLFIVNDYLDIAIASNSDGIHLGQDDIPITTARKELAIDKIIGCSVRTISQAIKAFEDGADYIAVGSIFATKTKPDTAVTGIDVLEQIKDRLDLPLVAIGGINLDNAEQIKDSGADALAIISAILKSEDIEETTRKFVGIFKT
jgi:thiamine-phosphate pyrophosphorylase